MSAIEDCPDLSSEQIFGLKTFEGGSAKIQRIPLIPELFGANTVEELIDALCNQSNRIILAEFIQNLREEGYESPAASVENLLNKCDELTQRIQNGNLRSKDMQSIFFALKYVYSAMFKTAGNLTMFWGGWATNPNSESIKVFRGTDIGLTSMEYGVQIPPETFSQLSQTNQFIYNILVSLFNQAADNVQNVDNIMAIRKEGIDIAAQGVNGINVGFGQGKESIKIDYKLDRNGRAAVVDINAGNMGIPDGADILGNSVLGAIGAEQQKVTDSVIEAVICTFAAKELRLPSRVSIMVLDQGMYDLNKLDVDMYINSIKCFAAKRGIFIDVNVVFTDGENLIDVDGTGNIGATDILFRYTNRTKVAPTVRESAGMVIPEPFTNLIADKVSGQIIGNLGKTFLPDNILIPQEVQSSRLLGDYSAEELIEEAFSVGLSGNWDGIVIKTATKFRKENGSGMDFPTAFIYPLTEIGKQVALAEMKSLLKNLKENVNASNSILSFNQLFTGSLDSEGLNRQAEIRVITTLNIEA